MRLVRIALANVNSTVGACRSNVDRAVALARSAASDGATLVAMPEQLIGGYPPEDLVQWRAFVDAQRVELARFARETAPLGCACALGLVVARGSNLYNVAALVHAGHVWGFVPKEKLPLYNVFYEARTLARGSAGLYDTLAGVPFGDLVFELDFGTLALEVCEDGWSPDGPMRRRSYAGAELVCNLSASPFRLGVAETRREMIATRAADCQATVAYVNAVGANDGLVFDGGGFVAQNGRLLHSSSRFREGVEAVTLDLDRTRRLRTENTTWREDQEAFAALAPRVTRVSVDAPTKGRDALVFPAPAHKSFFLPLPETPRSARDKFCEELLDALALGVGDYFEKTGCVQDDRRRALGRPRQPPRPRHRAPLDRPALGRSARRRTPGEGPGAAPRLLPAHSVLVGRDARRRRAAWRSISTRPSRSCRSTTRSSASSRPSRRCCSRARR